YCIINNSETDATTVELPKSAEVYKLHADTLRATVMKLNGRELVLGANNELPDLSPETMEGTLTLEPATIAFVVM
ncbi:MAG: beta-glucuronidase, partial [Agathobacter sp.]|nr:beta-glucuronidase [Agathobacter sp.]